MKKKDYSDAVKWSWEFTKIVITAITVTWIASIIFSAIILVYAIQTTNQFSYLDTFITEVSDTFRNIVGIHVIKAGIENVFKYNDIFNKRKKDPSEDIAE